MCFRPAIAEKPFECPECGKRINPIMGQIPTTCPFCESDITEAAHAAMAQSAGAPPESAFAKPSAPGAPKAPGAPGSPVPPSAPKAPGA